MNYKSSIVLFGVEMLLLASLVDSRIPYIAGGLPATNGNATRLGEFPFMAALGWKDEERGLEFLCGGVLISSKLILTAAHCACNEGKLPDVVFLGGNPLTEYKPFGILTYWAHRAIIYPEYDPNQAYHDIAMLEISNHHTEYEGIQPICLWNGENLTNNETITAIGYGLTEFAGQDSKQLLKVDLKVFSAEFCKTLYKEDKKFKSGISKAHFCAGDKDGIKDTCQGDSGGPLILKHKGQIYAVGITSSGQACSGFPPGIYTKISFYIDWITRILENHGEHLESCG